MRAPIALDASQSVWPIASADGIICINMIHISPWDATGKYPPAKPGALKCEPLEAVGGVADAAP